jgi:DNA polymerase (family X)
MENKEIASYFKLCGQLMELHEENKFKVRSYTNAAFQVSRYVDPIYEMDPMYYGQIPGMGKALMSNLEELLDTERMSILDDLLESTPKGVVEMLSIKGVGPSKVRVIWRDMGIESPGELHYACNENRLVDFKGFGEKTQQAVKESIEFIMEHSKSVHYIKAEPVIEYIIESVQSANPGAKITAVGDAGRKSITLSQLDFVVSNATALPDISEITIQTNFHEVAANDHDIEAFKLSSKPEHLEQLKLGDAKTTQEVYAENGVGYIPEEMREGHREFEWVKKYNESQLITDADLVGCLHNHSTYSDGIHTLQEMARYLNGLGYSYFGICDHSQTAVYAGGLTPFDIIEQHEEIDHLNADMAPFKILKGIESDILPNGDLDYSDDILATFDFIVASIHSAMKMDEEAATKRLIKAVENPYTSILGHPTGRLLLSRPGYPIDHKKVIDACAANNVSIELNANPMRLDIDWTWIHYCQERNVMVSINPDAHRKEGFHHMKYGVIAARKGGLVKDMCLNALGLTELQKKFKTK